MTAPRSALDLPAYDAHQHVDLSRFSLHAEDAIEELHADLTARVDMMRASGIACSVLMPSYDYDKRHGVESTAQVTESLLQYQAWAPDLFPWLGCTAEPQHYGAGVELLEKTLATGRFRIASWHNRYQGLSADSPVMFEFVEVAAHYGCVIFLHATGNLDHEEAWRIARLVRAFPDVRFVVLDGMMTYSSIQILSDLVPDVDNTWIDTAGATTFLSLLRDLGKRIGWKRILFGSDYYGDGRGGTASLLRQQLDLCGLSDDELQDVFQRNLTEVLEWTPSSH